MTQALLDTIVSLERRSDLPKHLLNKIYLAEKKVADEDYVEARRILKGVQIRVKQLP